MEYLCYYARWSSADVKLSRSQFGCIMILMMVCIGYYMIIYILLPILGTP
jgi:hypothetical protein